MEREWIDTVAVGDPEVVVSLPNGETLIGLRVRNVEGYPMLPIRLDVLGRPLSFGRDGLDIDTSNVHSNPRRQADGDDGGDQA